MAVLFAGHMERVDNRICDSQAEYEDGANCREQQMLRKEQKLLLLRLLILPKLIEINWFNTALLLYIGLCRCDR